MVFLMLLLSLLTGGAGWQAHLRNIRPPRVFTPMYAWAHMNTSFPMRILS
jgi:hypothetical protein